MLKTIYIKDISEDLHRLLKVQAALESTTMRELIIKYCEEGLKRAKRKEKGG